MITLLIVLGAVAAYLGIGYRAALWNVPGSWERAREMWSSDYNRRGDVRLSFLTMLFLWPARLPSLFLTGAVERAIDRGDPKRLQDELERRRRRIAELERELGL